MNWKTLLSPARFGQAKAKNKDVEDIRSEFQRDYDRIIFSSPFRRLQNKTQVFPLPGSVFVHNRLTHSLEVASVGRSLGNSVYALISKKLEPSEKKLVREIGTVVATACLAHDLGNPPFGHSGEKAISAFFEKQQTSPLREQLTDAEFADLVTFEGNANLVRLLTHQFNGRRKGGYALTYASLGTMIKYPYGSLAAGKKKKFGYFQSEKDTFLDIMEQLNIPEIDGETGKFARHPLVYLMEAADDICYQVMDLEDAQKLNILDREVVKNLFLDFFAHDEAARKVKIGETLQEVTDQNEQLSFLRAMVIGKLTHAVAQVFSFNYKEIMQGTFTGKLLDHIDPILRSAMQQCEEISFHKVYKHPSVIKIEISGYNVLGALLEEFYTAIMEPNKDYNQKILSLMPDQYKTANAQPVYSRARAVVDFVSAMTDVYAVALFKQIRGLEL